MEKETREYVEKVQDQLTTHETSLKNILHQFNHQSSLLASINQQQSYSSSPSKTYHQSSLSSPTNQQQQQSLLLLSSITNHQSSLSEQINHQPPIEPISNYQPEHIYSMKFLESYNNQDIQPQFTSKDEYDAFLKDLEYFHTIHNHQNFHQRDENNPPTFHHSDVPAYIDSTFKPLDDIEYINAKYNLIDSNKKLTIEDLANRLYTDFDKLKSSIQITHQNNHDLFLAKITLQNKTIASQAYEINELKRKFEVFEKSKKGKSINLSNIPVHVSPSSLKQGTPTQKDLTGKINYNLEKIILETGQKVSYKTPDQILKENTHEDVKKKSSKSPTPKRQKLNPNKKIK